MTPTYDVVWDGAKARRGETFDLTGNLQRRESFL